MTTALVLTRLKNWPRQDRGRGGGRNTQGLTPLPEEAFDVAYRRNNVCAGPSHSGCITDSWYRSPDRCSELGGNHDAHCRSLHVHGALLCDEVRDQLSGRGIARSVTGITGLANGVELPGVLAVARRPI